MLTGLRRFALASNVITRTPLQLETELLCMSKSSQYPGVVVATIVDLLHKAHACCHKWKFYLVLEVDQPEAKCCVQYDVMLAHRRGNNRVVRFFCALYVRLAFTPVAGVASHPLQILLSTTYHAISPFSAMQRSPARYCPQLLQ